MRSLRFPVVVRCEANCKSMIGFPSFPSPAWGQGNQCVGNKATSARIFLRPALSLSPRSAAPSGAFGNWIARFRAFTRSATVFDPSGAGLLLPRQSCESHETDGDGETLRRRRSYAEGFAALD